MSETTALTLRSALRKSTTDDSLEMTVDPRSRALGLDWVYDGSSIPQAERAENPTPFPVRSPTDRVLDLSSLDLTYDHPLDILTTASEAYLKSYNDYANHFMDVVISLRTPHHSKDVFDKAIDAVREVGRMIGGEIARTAGALITRTNTWSQAQRQVDINSGDLQGLEPVLLRADARELFHQALATATECTLRRAKWEEASNFGIGQILSAAFDYIDQFGNRGMQPGLASRLASAVSDFKAKHGAAQSKREMTEEQLRQYSDIEGFSEIYAQVKESTYEELTDGLAVFAQLVQMQKDDGSIKALVADDGKASDGAPKKFSLIRRRLDELLASQLQTPTSDPKSSMTPSKNKKKPHYDKPTSSRKTTLGRQHFAPLTPAQLRSVIDLPTGDTRTDTGEGFTTVSLPERFRPSGKRGFWPSLTKAFGMTIREIRDSFKTEESTTHVVPQTLDEAKSMLADLCALSTEAPLIDAQSAPSSSKWDGSVLPGRRALEDIQVVQQKNEAIVKKYGIKPKEKRRRRKDTKGGHASALTDLMSKSGQQTMEEADTEHAWRHQTIADRLLWTRHSRIRSQMPKDGDVRGDATQPNVSSTRQRRSTFGGMDSERMLDPINKEEESTMLYWLWEPLLRWYAGVSMDAVVSSAELSEDGENVKESTLTGSE